MYCDPSGLAREEVIPVDKMSYSDIKKEFNSLYSEFVKKKRKSVPSVSNELLKAELDYGKYGKLPKKKGDNITGHHMPANDYMYKVTNTKMKDSWAMNLEQPDVAGRHRRTFTYGLAADSRAKQLYDSLTPRDALAFDLYDAKRILAEDKVYDSFARERFQGYIDDYTSDKNFKEIFDKDSDYNNKSTCKKK